MAGERGGEKEREREKRNEEKGKKKMVVGGYGGRKRNKGNFFLCILGILKCVV